jgi:hypothetical protein
MYSKLRSTNMTKEEKAQREFLKMLFSEENQTRAVHKAVEQSSRDQDKILKKYQKMIAKKA